MSKPFIPRTKRFVGALWRMVRSVFPDSTISSIICAFRDLATRSGGIQEKGVCIEYKFWRFLLSLSDKSRVAVDQVETNRRVHLRDRRSTFPLHWATPGPTTVAAA